MYLVHVLQVHVGTAGVLKGPVVVPVEDYAHFGCIFGPQGLGAKLFQLLAKLGALLEYPGVPAA